MEKKTSKVASGIAPDREIRILDPAPAVARHLLDVMKEEGLYLPVSGTDGTGKRAEGYVRLLASGPADTLLRLYSTL